MIKLVLIFKLFLITVFLDPVVAAENNLGRIFDEYQKSYRANDFDSAKNTLEEALQSHTHNSYLIYNLGLTEYKLGRVGTAIGHWRRAQEINPRLKQAPEAIDYAVSQMTTKPLAKNTDSTWAWLQVLVLENLSLNLLWPIFLIVFTVSGMAIIRFFANKKKAFENDEPAPVLSTKVWTLLAALIVTGILTVITYIDHSNTRATAIFKPTEVKTGPGAEYGTLFEIPEGTEVLIRDNQEGWYKIEDPTGRIGWVAKDHLLITTM